MSLISTGWKMFTGCVRYAVNVSKVSWSRIIGDIQIFPDLELEHLELQHPVLWIHIGFDADPDTGFYLYVDPNSDLGAKQMLIRILTWFDFIVKKVEFLMQLHTGAEHFGNVIKRGIAKRGCS